MKNASKTKSNFINEDAPGIAGILASLFANLAGPVIVVAILCFAINYACQFAGVDFDAFQWVEDLIGSIPGMIQYAFVWVQNLLNNVTQ